MEPLPSRPPPPRSAGQVARDWLAWFGVGRLLASAIAVATVGAGAYWLVRAPATPVEDSLPFAPTTTSSEPASTTRATELTSIVVYVAGAVVAPAVYDLPAGARVGDAIALAGGLAADADSEVLNLAALLHDGDRIYVPRAGQSVPPALAPAGAAPSAPAGPVNINDATAEMLDALPGIGPATAAAIVAHRQQNGPFASVDELADVRGIGPAKLDAIRALITV